MDAYQILFEQIAGKVSESNQSKGKQSFAASKSDLSQLATAFLNTPDHTVSEYTYSSKDTSGTGEPLKIEKRPAMRYRNSLIPMLRQLGLDRNDAERIKEIPFTKEHAESLMEVAAVVQHDYMKAGRKFVYPITDPESTRMEVTIQRVPERVSVGNRFDKNPSAEAVTTITKPRSIVKAKNPVPYWLKEVQHANDDEKK